jgi:hypothetical protein
MGDPVIVTSETGVTGVIIYLDGAITRDAGHEQGDDQRSGRLR